MNELAYKVVKPKVIVDTYEPELMKAYLEKFGCDIEIKCLRDKGGDYVLTGSDGKQIGIERKSIRDLILSLIQKQNEKSRATRLYQELDKLKNYDTRILLIEGYYPKWASDWEVCIGSDKHRLHRNTLFGVMVWCIQNGIYVVHTSNLEETAGFISVYAKKLSKQISA